MSTTQTRCEGFCKVSSQISASQFLVWRALKRFPNGLTNMELAEILSWSINRVTPRIGELRNLGYVREFCVRKCRITGSNAQTNIALEESPQTRMF